MMAYTMCEMMKTNVKLLLILCVINGSYVVSYTIPAVRRVSGNGISGMDHDFTQLCVGTACLCDYDNYLNDTTMDCTAKHVRIRDVCRTVGALTATILKAGSNNFGRINEDDLKGCEHLIELDLHYNQIVTLPTTTFRSFTRLQRLDLSVNNLEVYVVNGSFNSGVLPDSLKVLYLNGNVPDKPWKKSMSYPDLSKLKELNNLYMDGVQTDFGPDYRIISVSSVTLSGKNLFTYCNISNITDTTFANLISVRTLNISSCNLQNVTAGAFQSLKHLHNLDMSYNIRLGFSQLGIFMYGLQFTDIRVLNYSYVYPTFGVGTVVRLSHLCFMHNTSINHLSVNGNRIVMFDTNALLLLPKSLQKAELDDNKPSFGPYLSQLGCLPNLTYFRANSQSQYHSPKSYLVDVSFSDGPGTDDPSQIKCPFMTTEYLMALKTDECPYLYRDNFSMIFNITFPPNLKDVIFRDCSMNYEVDAKIEVRPRKNSLETVDVSGNNFYSLEGPVGPFPNAKKVVLSRNYCQYIGPNFFNDIFSLEHLDFSDNYLGPFFTHPASEKVFWKLASLKQLHLEENKITSFFIDTFTPLKNLTGLYLTNNKLKVFEINLEPLTSLSYLDLSNNFLAWLSSDIMNVLSRNFGLHNVSVDLGGNPLRLLCDNKTFIRWIFNNNQHMIGYQNLTFNSNVTLNNATFNKFESSCRSYTLPIVIGSIGLAVFLSVVIVGVVYRNRWKIRYFLYMSKVGLLGYARLSERPDTVEYTYDAFISYAEEDHSFITGRIIPTLEKHQGMKLCVHERDFMAGKPISDNIIDAIRNSRKTVIVLSNVFMRKKWCVYEFNMARMESIYSRDDSNHIVVVMLEDVKTENMPLEVMEWIQSNSYIEHTQDEQGETLFQSNLIQAVAS